MAGSIASQSRLRERRRRRRVIVFSLVFVLVVLVGTGAVIFMREPFVRIRAISVTGTSTIASSTLEQFVRAELSGDYLYVFPKDNIALYPKHTLQAAVLMAFPMIRSVTVRTDALTAVSLSVSERQPVALWCGTGGVIASSTSDGCLLMDGDGMAYAQAPHFSQPVYTPYYGALPGGGTTLPAQFLSADAFHSLSALIGALAQEANDGMPARVIVDENSDVHMQFADGFVLLFALSDDAGKVAQHFTLALASAPFTSHALSSFEYLDLRFGDKLYFKLK